MNNSKPFYHATLAAGYIMFLVNGMNSFSKPNTPDIPTVLVPMMMLSLLTLSAATMGFLFFWEPIQMFIKGEHEKALNFFGHTLAWFTGYFAFFALAMLYVIR